MPRQLRTPQPARGRRVFSAKRLLLTAAGGAAALGIALSGVGGSYALFSSQAYVSAGSLSTGSAGLTAAWSAGHDARIWQNMLPGESQRQGFVLDNTGDVAMELSASVIADAPGFEVRAVASPCATSPLGVPALASQSAPLGSAWTPATSVVVSARGSITGCIEVRATASAAAAGTTAFTITLDGRQAP